MSKYAFTCRFFKIFTKLIENLEAKVNPPRRRVTSISRYINEFQRQLTVGLKKSLNKTRTLKKTSKNISS